MNQSIYTEYANLTPDHIQWLDGCGEISPLGSKASEITPISNHSAFILVSGFDPHGANQYFACGEIEHCESKNYAHIPTGSEFCERVAEILEIDKPVFASDLKDKLVKKLEMHDRMERPLPEVEDKGLAIEVKLLGKEDMEWLVGNVGGASITFSEIYGAPFDPKYIVYTSPNYYPFPQISFSKFADLKDYDLTITTDPNEFMRYVAEKTGKEWKPMNDQYDHTESHLKPSYPHRTYRVLDSLDDIPLDTRIPLSEWIPPCKSEVLFISKRIHLFGEFVRIDFQGIIIKDKDGFHYTLEDGHWMRIV